jgi:hypothetical protein
MSFHVDLIHQIIRRFQDYYKDPDFIIRNAQMYEILLFLIKATEQLPQILLYLLNHLQWLIQFIWTESYDPIEIQLFLVLERI